MLTSGLLDHTVRHVREVIHLLLTQRWVEKGQTQPLG